MRWRPTKNEQARSTSPDPIDPNTLIAELPEWNGGPDVDGGGVDALSWVQMMGNYEWAVGYSLIFWPRFVGIEDHVLRADATVEYLRSWQKSGTHDRRAIESVMNHIHIADIHCNIENPTEAQMRYLGRVLTEIHRVKLAHDFPERRFEVWFDDTPGQDLIDYQFTFYQVAD